MYVRTIRAGFDWPSVTTLVSTRSRLNHMQRAQHVSVRRQRGDGKRVHTSALQNHGQTRITERFASYGFTVVEKHELPTLHNTSTAER
jgi:hypothetical protein